MDTHLWPCLSSGTLDHECGPQPEFRACADISIIKSGNNNETDEDQDAFDINLSLDKEARSEFPYGHSWSNTLEESTEHFDYKGQLFCLRILALKPIWPYIREVLRDRSALGTDISLPNKPFDIIPNGLVT